MALDPVKQITEKEWEALLRHCEKTVRGRLARIGFVEEIIEEALLTTVLKIVEKEAENVEMRRETLLAYLWNTAYRCAIDLGRKTRRESPLHSPGEEWDEGAELVSSRPDPEREAVTKSDVERCLGKLPAIERAIVLHKSYGRTSKEIRKLVGIESEASVNTRYCQSCKFLRQCLDSSKVYALRARGVTHGSL